MSASCHEHNSSLDAQGLDAWMWFKLSWERARTALHMIRA